MTPERRGRWRMLTRVLAVMMAGVLAVQLVNFALLQFAPLPQPPAFSVAEVAAVLGEGRDPHGEFSFADRAEMAATQQGRAVRLAAALARELRVGEDRIRLSFVDPPRIGRGPPRGGSILQNQPAARDSLLVGDFTAGLRRPRGGWLVIQPVRSGMTAWRLGLLLWLLAALVTVTPFAWLLARWVTRPIALFEDAAKRIGVDPHTAPLNVAGPPELAHAARAMNEMQARLNAYVDDRTVMIGAIAHDLRTPLMRMALRLDRVPRDLRRGIERDMADMQAMIAAATDYVRGTTRTGARRRLDLRSLAESAIDDLLDQGHRAAVMPGEQVAVDGSPVALRAVLDNLLSNAVRYAGDAEVTVRSEDRLAILEVRDHGPGVPEAELERMFEPFARGEISRNRETGGTGLGLASVRSVARLHGGDASISNHPDGGLLARIVLPLAPIADDDPNLRVETL